MGKNTVVKCISKVAKIRDNVSTVFGASLIVGFKQEESENERDGG